jgi:hypothetical protein
VTSPRTPDDPSIRRVVPREAPLPPTPTPRPGFFEFRRRHPGFVTAIIALIVACCALDGFAMYKRTHYQDETRRLRAGMNEAERQRTDAILSSREKRTQMIVQLIKRQARWSKEIHLAISVDSGRMYLEREGALLREIPIRMGPERRIGTAPDTVHLAIPRGTRSVQAVLSDSDAWQVPAWVYTDRGLKPPPPAQRTLTRALGPSAIVLDGGTVIYSLPTNGPLNDSSYTMPGSVRARSGDLDAIVPNVTKGMVVYFY